MSGLRRKRVDGGYRQGYLKSRAWWGRRARFLRSHGDLRCECLGEELTERTAQVHHVSYEGVFQDEEGAWRAEEHDEDLMVLCAWCHERVHQLMDRDRGWSGASRRGATRSIIRTIQRRVLMEAVRLTTTERA